MIFSDFNITTNRTVKVEIHPTDLLDKHTHVLEAGDMLITVFRPVDSPFAAERLQADFLEEFKHHYHGSIPETLVTTIQSFNSSLLNPPADRQLRPQSGVEVLVVYISPDRVLTFAQVGSVTLKKRQNGRYTALTKQHSLEEKPHWLIGHPQWCDGDDSASVTEVFISTTHLYDKA